MKLSLKNINKSFGKNKVLNNLSFDVQSGRAMGFLGRNGAGKTTTIRCIMDVFRPDSGEILIDNKPFSVLKYKVGYMPEVRGLYEKEPVLDQLVYFGQLRGMDHKDAKKSALSLLEKVKLSEYASKNMETLSKGNQQKIQIIQALINDPEILILDEPFSGLDPINAQVLKDIIKEKIQEKKLVIFSSHQMNYVEEFCDDISLLHSGEIIVSGSLDSIKKEMSQQRYRFSLSPDTQESIDILVNNGFEITKADRSFITTLSTREQREKFQNIIVQNHLLLEKFGSFEPTLNDIFLEKVGQYETN